jgi:hypothetical protein
MSISSSIATKGPVNGSVLHATELNEMKEKKRKAARGFRFKLARMIVVPNSKGPG